MCFGIFALNHSTWQKVSPESQKAQHLMKEIVESNVGIKLERGCWQITPPKINQVMVMSDNSSSS